MFCMCVYDVFQSYDDKLRAEGQEKGDKKQVFKYSSEGEVAERLMNSLKERVYDNRGKVGTQKTAMKHKEHI